MQVLTLARTAEIIEDATFEHTADRGCSIVHTGTTEAGQQFVLTNDCHGHSSVGYAP